MNGLSMPIGHRVGDGSADDVELGQLVGVERRADVVEQLVQPRELPLVDPDRRARYDQPDGALVEQPGQRLEHGVEALELAQRHQRAAVGGCSQATELMSVRVTRDRAGWLVMSATVARNPAPVGASEAHEPDRLGRAFVVLPPAGRRRWRRGRAVQRLGSGGHAELEFTNTGGCGDAYFWATTADDEHAVVVWVELRERSATEPTVVDGRSPTGPSRCCSGRAPGCRRMMCNDVSDGR